MFFIRILLFVAFPLTALAETPMTAEEFDRYSKGKTLFYSSDGQRYGAEEYLDRRRVRWSFLDGQCKEGSWYASGSDICFVYEDNPDPQCWQFFSAPGGLTARFVGDDRTTLYEMETSDDEMLCLGPQIGV